MSPLHSCRHQCVCECACLPKVSCAMQQCCACPARVSAHLAPRLDCVLEEGVRDSVAHRELVSLRRETHGDLLFIWAVRPRHRRSRAQLPCPDGRALVCESGQLRTHGCCGIHRQARSLHTCTDFRRMLQTHS